MRERVNGKSFGKQSSGPGISCRLVFFVTVVCLNVFEIEKLQGGTERPSEHKV